jgi:hypothetical protein
MRRSDHLNDPQILAESIAMLQSNGGERRERNEPRWGWQSIPGFVKTPADTDAALPR